MRTATRGNGDARRRGAVRAAVRAGAASACIAAAETAAYACPVCFQIEDGPVASGVRAAIVVLVGVTAGVLAGFVWFLRGTSLFAPGASAGEDRP